MTTVAGRTINRIARRLLLVVLLGLTWGWAGPANAAAFSYDQLVERARALAEKPYQPPEKVPENFARLGYSQWNAIHFKRSRALWQDTRFHVHLDPAGYLFDRPVTIHIVANGDVRRLAFSPDMYRVNDEILAQPLPPDLGFSGFRLTYPINSADKQDEFLSFLGASYFRAVPEGGWYGLSARGIAINTTAHKPEQFPSFTDFWLVKPAPEADQMTIYALLNGNSITGAYRFRVKPGGPTVMDVRATLFLRNPVQQLGVAPLTSMYFYGVGNHTPHDQMAPAVHDSDGLLIHRGDDQWLWRPLANPPQVRTLSFAGANLRGFGLMQRNRREENYLAPKLHYADRPSVWIQLQGDWPAGQVKLVEIPTDDSYMDNIVAFWSPEKLPAPGQPLRLNYRMTWRIQPVPSAVGRVTTTLIGGNKETGAAKYVIDYVGGALAGLDKGEPPNGWVQTYPDTAITENRVLFNPYTGGWRQVIQVMPRHKQPVHIKAGLGQPENPLTEIWDYTLTPSNK